MTGEPTLLRRLSASTIGPDATTAEMVLSWAAALVGLVAQLAVGVALGWAPLQVGVAALLAGDVAGGVVVNNTQAGRAYWHRPTYRHRALFFLAHVHPLVIAALWPGFPMLDAVGVYLGILAAAAVTTWAPAPLARPVAVAATAVGVILARHATLPPGLEWLPALLLLKLVVGHAVPPEGGSPPELTRR